jgi:hypothetical protein
MSLATFKKKSVTLYGTNVSGKPDGGFSIYGRYRNQGGVGQSSLMLTNVGTPMKGKYAMGHGGTYGNYKTEILYNVMDTSAVGSTTLLAKPSVLTTYGMLHKRYSCLYNGVYPNYVVKNVFTGNLTDNKSQGIYIRDVESANLCVNDINNNGKYINTCSNDCIGTQHKKIYPGVSNGRYIKPINGALDQSTYLLYVTKPCNQADLNNDHIPKPTNGNNSCIYGCGGDSNSSSSNN